VRRRLDDRISLSAREARLLLDERGFDFFRSQNKGDEYGFAASAGVVGGRTRSGRSGGIWSGRQAGQAVTAVDQLFDCEEQELILRHRGEVSRALRSRRNAYPPAIRARSLAS
jgi:hypothetical protein